MAQCFALLPPSIKAWTQLPAHWPSLCVKFFTGCSWFQPVYSGRGRTSQQPWGWMEVKKILGVLTGEYDTVTLWKSPVLPCIIQEASYRRHQMTLISFIYSHFRHIWMGIYYWICHISCFCFCFVFLTKSVLEFTNHVCSFVFVD